MRLGEIKNIIERCLNENKQLFIDQEAIFGNQAYKIKNYGMLMDALVLLSEQRRGNADFGPIQAIIDKYGFAVATVQMPVQQFNQLNAYVSALNGKIPLYYSILETMVEDQDEQMINIKIPENKVKNLSNLTDFNKRLDKIFKQFQLDGEFEFKGLDKGTDWYVIGVTGIMSYRIFISCLKLGQEYLKTKKAYYESKKAELDYKAGLKKPQEFEERAFELYKEVRMNLEIEYMVNESLIQMQNKEKGFDPETINKTIMATKSLIKELGEGTEFHLSLNPPPYAEEIGGSLEINYKKLSAIIQAENAPKKLENKNEIKEDDAEQKNKSE